MDVHDESVSTSTDANTYVNGHGCGPSSGGPLQLEARVDQGEGFPDPSLLWRLTKNLEEWCFGDFLGLPKESFNDTFNPFGGLVGDPIPLEETVESDSERGE
ncbi:hypothetical protein Taro_048708 [Colocasia esculenta]|uniref:Uncharacterized protein n=1 Tax=Colocasia esculenta TaxID=4460 RepID=A0A843X8X5_COLES|nr:hypothetical protein [Colocasia esculenta]